MLDRFKGTLVGVHVGDSIGAPYETWGPKAIADDLQQRGQLEFFDYKNPWAKDGNEAILPAGRPTDDSDQTADLCFSLLANNASTGNTCVTPCKTVCVATSAGSGTVKQPEPAVRPEIHSAMTQSG